MYLLRITLMTSLFVSFLGTAQDLGGGSGRLLPSGGAPSSSSQGSALQWKVEEKPMLPATSSGVNLTKQESFVNANEPYLKELNAKLQPEVPVTKMTKNGGSIGYIQTTSPYVILSYRDSGEVDGDQIRLFINGEIARGNLVLNGRPGQFRVDLRPGVNTIEFMALNEGQVSPNTAAIEVLDENGSVLGGGGWNLEKGNKASLTVLKK
ncbi:MULTISPECIES: hypothetical protein [unclassified Flavobacterium]|uniref:hypothetical protein n=1 Tax=unclassified Flavobacterium TaxID=196869 RepID=UPI001F1450AF|nr:MULTISPECIES: hypothetical protein [unclassified Flavobacterium]UMY64364.1 hypothetical protein MKO97_07540 [Flavobacterium sp. HJ-32-4]